MKENPIRIKYRNSANPNSAFDMLKLEGLFQRKNLNHNIEKLHRVDFFTLIFVTGGQGAHTIDFTDYNYERGSILTIRKDQIHKFFRSEDIKGYLLLFMDEFLMSYLEKLEAQKTLQLFKRIIGCPKNTAIRRGFFDH